MDDNAQQQADEIAVLQSIYADDVVFKEEEFAMEINVNVPIKQPFSVISPPPQQNANAPPPAIIGEALPVVGLPPILLTITYHPAYPSDEPPMFTLSCCWLSGLQLSEICRQFDQIWAEAKGEVVVFRWVSWLMEETISFLNIKSPYVLPIYEVSPDLVDELDSRAESTCDRFTIGQLIDFDKFMRRQIFFQSEHTCGICYMDYPGIQFVHQTTCEHPFCKDCMRQLCQINITQGSIAELKCPEKQCRKQILPQVIRELVNDELYARYERLLLDRSLSSMEDIMWCPHCHFAVIIDRKLDLGSCTNCNFSFCTNCMQTWHPGRECANSSGIAEALKQRVNSAKKELLAKVQAEMDSINWLVDHTRMCPRCKIPIEKTEGCNKMTCSKCGQYFCWNCRRAIAGYEHFGGACKLFPDTPLYYPDGQVAVVPNAGAGHAGGGALPVAIRREVARQLNYNNVQRVMLQRPDHIKRCPRCKNQVAKSNNNNHIACWNCGTQFCFLCMELIFGTAHFHKGKCKHHTED